VSAQPVRRRNLAVDFDQAFKDLPTLPNVVTRVLQITDSDHASAAEIERAVGSDQAICAKLLRVVNSPYFGLTGQVGDVGQAIVIMGFHQVRNLVLSIGAASAFTAKSPLTRQVQQDLWRHGFTMAAAAEIVGRRQRIDLRDMPGVFVGALLGNVGSLFLLREFPLDYVALSKRATAARVPIHDLEFEHFGVDHAKVGYELASRWRLPAELTLLIGRHEGPFEGQPVPALYAVHAADRVAASLVIAGLRTEDGLGIDPKVEAWLGWSEEDRAWVRQESLVRLEAMSDMMRVLA